MTGPLRKLFDDNKLHSSGPEPVQVLISLKTAADAACLEILRKLGLTVKLVNGNKVTGEIASRQIAKLKEQDIVADVERSVKLKPTDSQPDV